MIQENSSASVNLAPTDKSTKYEVSERLTSPKRDETCLMTVRELAEKLRLSPDTIRRHHAAGNLPPAVRIGRSLRWGRSQISEWLASPTVSAIVTPTRQRKRPRAKYLPGQRALWDDVEQRDGDPPPAPPASVASADTLAQATCSCPRDQWVRVGTDARGMGRITCGSCGRFVGYQRPTEQSPALLDHRDGDACPLFRGAGGLP